MGNNRGSQDRAVALGEDFDEAVGFAFAHCAIDSAQRPAAYLYMFTESRSGTLFVKPHLGHLRIGKGHARQNMGKSSRLPRQESVAYGLERLPPGQIGQFLPPHNIAPILPPIPFAHMVS